MNLIECTIKMKEEARAHYERLAEAISDKEMKRIFALLAAAEEEHLVMLRKLGSRAATMSRDEWGVDDAACSFRPRIDVINPGESLRNDPDGYRHVTEEEKDTIRFFEDMAERTNDLSLKRLCRTLAHGERKHLDRIEHIYAFVEDPRCYLEWGEFSNRMTI